MKPVKKKVEEEKVVVKKVVKTPAPDASEKIYADEGIVTE